MYNLMLSGIHVSMSRVVFKEKYVNEDPLKSTVHILNMKIYYKMSLSWILLRASLICNNISNVVRLCLVDRRLSLEVPISL